MNEKYKKLMEEGLDTLRVDDSTYGYYVDGFTDCHDEMVKDYQALERKLEVAVNKVKIAEKSIDRFVIMNLPNKKYIAYLDDLIEALAEIKG